MGINRTKSQVITMYRCKGFGNTEFPLPWQQRKETIENMTMKELESCIEAYGKDIYTFCLHLAGNKELADDLYQDTFLTALEGMERIDKEANTKSYLLSISIRIWKNTKRKWAWRNRIAPTSEIVENSAIDIAYEEKDGVLEDERLEVVKSAIERLPGKYKIIILLYYMEEMPQEKIAKILHLPTGTIKSRLYAARKILKSQLEEYFYE